MKEQRIFKKFLSAILSIVMIAGVFAMLPVSAETDETGEATEVRQAALIPYHLADSGDLLYTMDFRGDSAFKDAGYLEGQHGSWTFRKETAFTPSEDGTELTIKGTGKANSAFHWWGAEIEGLSLPSDGMLSMTYKAKPLARNGETEGTTNAVAVGGLSADPLGADAYVNYCNHNVQKLEGQTVDNCPEGDSLRRARINRRQTRAGVSAVDGVELTSDGYTRFDTLPNDPLIDADGYMTTLIEYDAKNGKINTYYLYTGTGALKTDWQPMQTAEYTWTENDRVGYWSFCSYRIVYYSLKDVSFYKGTVYQSTPLITVGSATELAALNATLADPSLDVFSTLRVQLTADIDMASVAYTPVSTQKKIQFNGNGYTISNLTIGTDQTPVENAALFASVGAGSSFRNFDLTNAAIYGKKFAAGVLANPAYGDLSFSNITVSGSVTDATSDADLASGDGHIGFAGALIGSNTYMSTCTTEVTWTIVNVTNKANVTATVSAAGLVGAACGAINFDVDYCANEGTIAVKGKGKETLDNQAAGLVNLRHHGNSTGSLFTDSRFQNSYNIGKLKLEAIHATTTAAGTAGIVGIYRVSGAYGQSPTPAYENTLEFTNCYDLSQREYPTTGTSVHASISVWTAKDELPTLSYTNCYGAPAADSPGAIASLYGGDCGPVTETNVSLVAAGDTTIALSTGSSSINEMITKLAASIEYLVEVEMPFGGFDDGMPRNYNWYYKNGELVQKGTADAPYEITSKEQFAALTSLTWGYQDPERVGGNDQPIDFNGKYFKLMTSVDLTGYQAVPINMNGGTIYFDGNGKTISNWTISNVLEGGMFSGLGRGSVIKNLTLNNVDVNALGTSAVLVATSQAGLTVENVHVKDTCSVTTTSKIGGGIIGAIIDEEAVPGNGESLGDVVKIRYCINEADVLAREILGGILAYRKGVFDYQIDYCVNKGDLHGTRTSGAAFFIGGIVGNSERGAEKITYYQSYIKSCYNVGKLSTVDTKSWCYIGGIAGYLKAQAASEIMIVHCYDYSARKVSATSGTLLKNAGLVGHADDAELLKYVEYSYAANVPDTEAIFAHVALWANSATSLIDDETVAIVSDIHAEVIVPSDEISSITAEMTRIDQAIASKSEFVWIKAEPTPDDKPTDEPIVDTTVPNENQQPITTVAPTETTAAPAKEEKKGCGSALNSTYAVIALISVLGFAFVAKKTDRSYHRP